MFTKKVIDAYTKTTNWYRSLSKGWKCFAWIVVVIVAMLVFVALVLPWILSSKYREQVAQLRRDAVLGDAKHEIEDAKKTVSQLEEERDAALDREQELDAKAGRVDGEIEQIDKKAEADKKKIGRQTDEEQGDFFNKRYSD